MTTTTINLAHLAAQVRDRLDTPDPHKIAAAMLAEMSTQERADALAVTLPDYIRRVVCQRSLPTPGARRAADPNFVPLSVSDLETSEQGTREASNPSDEPSPAPTPGPSYKLHGQALWKRSVFAPSIGWTELGALDRDSLRAVINFKYEKAAEVHVTAVRYEKLLALVDERKVSRVCELPASLVMRILDGEA